MRHTLSKTKPLLFVWMQETSLAKNNNGSSQTMIVCTKCKNTLPAGEFAKSQQKKSKKGKPCICLGCSAKMRGAKIPAKSAASSSATQVFRRQSSHIWEGVIQEPFRLFLEHFSRLRGQLMCNLGSKSPSSPYCNHVIPARSLLPASAFSTGG